MVHRVTCRAVLVLTVTLYGLVTVIATLVLGVLLRMQFSDMQANVEGDPEKMFVDDCMRDFEHLPTDDDKYRSQYGKCIKELASDVSLKRLPYIRLAVDERVCDPDDLCEDGDPGNCKDSGTPLTSDYSPGDVTKCYQLINDAKAEQDTYQKAELLDRVAAECTSSDRWKDHENKVVLEYCFWKHLQYGVCTNIMRTNCPTDSSCCPVSQNDPNGNPLDYRPDLYICQKSPVVGLYCQHRDYRVPVNNSIQQEGALCNKVTCPSFAWCRDLADIPGQCLGEACQDYSRAADFLIVCIVWTSLGMMLDFADLVLLVRWPLAAKLKFTGNAVSACLKLMTYMFCAAGGVKDFTSDLVDMQCFNADGNALAEAAKERVKLFEMVALLTVVGSLALTPMSMQWGGQLVGLPYARVS